VHTTSPLEAVHVQPPHSMVLAASALVAESAKVHTTATRSTCTESALMVRAMLSSSLKGWRVG